MWKPNLEFGEINYIRMCAAFVWELKRPEVIFFFVDLEGEQKANLTKKTRSSVVRQF